MVNLLHDNGAPGVYPQSWYAATAALPPQRPALDGEQVADVAIIGAGYTGLSAALHLAERGYKVVVLEAHRVGWGASGRNGGQAGSGLRKDQMELEASLGPSDAAKLWALTEEAKASLRGQIDRYGIDCELAPGIIEANHRARYDAEAQAYAEHMQAQYGYPARYLPPSELREKVGSPAYFGGYLDPGAFHLHPLKLALGLARAAEAAGVVINENSEVRDLSPGARVRVATAGGAVLAEHAILATNGYVGTLVDRVAARVLPINSFVIATEPLDEAAARGLIRDNEAVCDSRFVVNYFRLSPDRRLLFGGRESYGYRFSRDIKTFVRGAMLQIYPQLKDTRIDYGWGGTLGITLSRMPYLTRLSPNIISAAGYSGHGVVLANFCGRLAGEAVAGQAERFDVLAGLRTDAMPGGRRLRQPLMALGMLWFSLRDRL